MVSSHIYAICKIVCEEKYKEHLKIEVLNQNISIGCCQGCMLKPGEEQQIKYIL